MIIIQSVSSVEIACNELIVNITKEECTINFLHLSPTDVVTIKGKPIQLAVKTKITFVQSSMFLLPNQLFTKFVNLAILKAEGANIQTIHTKTFIDAENLQILLLANNFITTLPATAFNAAALKVIDLSNNLIETINQNAFYNSPSLTKLILSNNKLKSILPNTFNNLSSLMELHIDGNMLTTFTSNHLMLNHLYNVINLSKNPIETLTTDNIRTIVLDVSYINVNRLNITKDLEKVFAENCSIKEIMNLNSQKLQELHLRNNQIVDLKIIANFSKLKLLDVSWNPINLTTIAGSTFNDLQNLNLSHTGITAENFIKIKPGVSKLTELDVSNNLNSGFQLKNFINLTELHRLELINNNLTNFTLDSVKVMLPNIMEINLSLNPLSCKSLEAYELIGNQNRITIISDIDHCGNGTIIPTTIAPITTIKPTTVPTTTTVQPTVVPFIIPIENKDAEAKLTNLQSTLNELQVLLNDTYQLLGVKYPHDHNASIQNYTRVISRLENERSILGNRTDKLLLSLHQLLATEEAANNNGNHPEHKEETSTVSKVLFGLLLVCILAILLYTGFVYALRTDLVRQWIDRFQLNYSNLSNDSDPFAL